MTAWKRTTRRLLPLVLGTVLFAGCRSGKSSAPVGLEGHFERHQGGGVELSALRGKVVVLNFWATWCTPCVKEIPELVQVAHEMEPRGVVLLAVNQDGGEATQVKDTVEEFFFTHPSGLRPYVVYAEEGFTRQLKIQGLPTTYLLDGKGQEVAHFVGGLSAPALREGVERALKARLSP